MRAFAQADRFVSEVEARKLRPVYVFVGDEVFFRKRCREAILKHLVPADLRDFSLFEFDLSETDLAEVLDGARTPSLMVPFQVFFIRGVKTLFGRGSNEEKLAAIEEYSKDPNPDAVLIFVADHISIPADARRMDMTDKERYERIRETLGGYCAIVELARVEESEAVRWIGEYGTTRDVKSITTKPCSEFSETILAAAVLKSGRGGSRCRLSGCAVARTGAVIAHPRQSMISAAAKPAAATRPTIGSENTRLITMFTAPFKKLARLA